MRIPRVQFRACSIFLFLVLGTACDGSLNVNIQGDAPSEDGTLRLELSDIEFVNVDGDSRRFNLNQQLIFDEDGLALTSLISDQEVPTGNYQAINLTIDATSSSYDQDGDPDTAELQIEGNSIVVSAEGSNFRIDEDEDANLILHFSSFASLPATETGATTQVLQPQLRYLQSQDARNLEVTLSGDDVISQFCAEIDDQLPRLYIFDTANSTANDDLDSGTDDALRVVFAQLSMSDQISRQWSIPNLPTGSYRIALSCDADDPVMDDDIAFFCDTTLNDFSGSTTLSLDTESSDAGCG